MPYQADSPASKNADDKLYFNIGRQSLTAALRQYSEVTGQAVMVDDALAAGRKSSGVRGDFRKVDALLMLLVGTGLAARYASDQAFTLGLVNDNSPGMESFRSTAGIAVSQGSEEVSQRYAGEIQKPIEAALCQSEKTRPGTYRMALQIWVSSAGKVEKTQLLSTAESTAARDTEVIRLMDQLLLDPPPAQMAQPITLLFLPGRRASAPGCSTASHSRRER